MSESFLALRRLRVLAHGRAVYDEKFHLGVNVNRANRISSKPMTEISSGRSRPACRIFAVTLFSLRI